MITCRVLNLVLYCGLTTAIVYRLWYAHRRLGRPFLDGGRYKGALLTVAESGALFSAASIVVFILSVMNTPALAAAVSPTTQLAVSFSSCFALVVILTKLVDDRPAACCRSRWLRCEAT